MDYKAWNVDLKAKSAYHVSGFKIVVEGDLSQPMGVFPSNFPNELTAFEQAKLLRSGMEAVSLAATVTPIDKKKHYRIIQVVLFKGCLALL